MLPNVLSHYLKVTQETPKNPEFFCKIISPVFFEPVSAALLLLATAGIVPFWVVIQLEAYLTPLLATGLQLTQIYSVPP